MSVVLVFGLSQLLVSVNGTLASMLQARSTVSGLALVNVTSKVIWGVGTIAALVLGSPLVGLAAVLFGSELVKAIVLFRLVRTVYRASRSGSIPAPSRSSSSPPFPSTRTASSSRSTRRRTSRSSSS